VFFFFLCFVFFFLFVCFWVLFLCLGGVVFFVGVLVVFLWWQPTHPPKVGGCEFFWGLGWGVCFKSPIIASKIKGKSFGGMCIKGMEYLKRKNKLMSEIGLRVKKKKRTPVKF